MSSKVRKAVFPAAGLGTRFLPATKAQPKEMLPLVDKPLIQYGVEEALHSGIQNIIIVTGRGKSAIEDHFDVSFELENLLETRGRKDLRLIVRKALGLRHAALRATELVRNEPSAVVLADDVIESKSSIINGVRPERQDPTSPDSGPPPVWWPDCTPGNLSLSPTK